MQTVKKFVQDFAHVIYLNHLKELTAGLYSKKWPSTLNPYIFYNFSDHHLISTSISIAKSVEILNLSGNDIAIVERESFKNLKAIINLSLSRNTIAQIDIFAFIDLEKISVLDLSDNRLEQISFDNGMLESNEKLTFLDLSKNNFMTTFDSPFLISNSLEILALRNSKISHIFDSFFSELQNLMNLDLSENLLITLSVAAVKPLRKLHVINLEYNRIFCDLIDDVLKRFKSMKVIIKIDKCGKASKKPMFEKMIMQPTAVPTYDIDIDLLWGGGFKNNSTTANDETKVTESFVEYYEWLRNDTSDFAVCEQQDFELFCDCKEKFIKIYDIKNLTNHVLVRQTEQRIVAVFYVGLFLGALFGISLFYSIQVFIKKCENLKKQQDLRQRDREQLQLRTISAPPRENEILHTRNIRPSSQAQINNNNSNIIRPSSQAHQLQRINNNSIRSNNSMSSTAHLIHKLFRNRESRQPLEVEEASSSNNSNDVRVVESDSNQVYNEANESLLPSTSTRSVTPPPPYISIFN